MALDPQVKTLLDQMAAMGGPPISEQTPEEARLVYAAMRGLAGEPGPIGSVIDRSIPGPAGDIPVRIYVPEGEGPHPGVVFFHGGGWVIGDLDSHDPLCRELASGAGCVVVAVHYRLAPEDRFPAATDDALAATRWVAEHAAELGIDPARLAVAGDSAGGNLAAVTALRVRDEGGPALRFQLLIYPVTDCRMGHPSMEENAEGYLLTRDTMRWFIGHYLGDGGDPADPLASPLLAEDLSGLPPAHIIVAEYDPLRDEGIAYGERLRDAGVDVTVSNHAGMIHSFVSLGAVLDGGRKGLDEAVSALRAALHG